MGTATHRDIILVAVDFEEASMRAIEVAKDLAAAYDAEIVLAHACALPVYTYPGVAPISLASLEIEVTDAAQTALDRLSKQHGVRSVLLKGDAATEILREIERTKPRLVVVGTHGRRGLSRLLLGSVAEKIVRRSNSPVVTVPVVRSEA